MNRDLVIGVDSSTTGCKAIVWDRQGNFVAEGRATQAMSLPHPGWHEQPATEWWRTFRRAIRQALRTVDLSRLAALAIANQRETFVVVDNDGLPLRSGILWMDERAGDLLPELKVLLGEKEFHRMSGKPLTANLSIAKLYWLKKNEPELFSHIANVLDVQAYLVKQLIGEAISSWGSADPTGLFDLTSQRWSEQTLEMVGLRMTQMPHVMPPGAVIGQVNRVASKATGLPVGLPVASGIGDGQAGGLGMNISRPGVAYLALGTSVISGVYSGRYAVSPAFRTMCGGIPGTHMLETVLLGGTYTVDWLLKTLLGRSPSTAARLRFQLDNSLDLIPPGAEGLVVIPYWNSAMTPYWDSSASGIILGLRGYHRREHIYRAILEGIALELRLHYEGVETELGEHIQQLVVMGGGAQNGRWCQIIADVTGKTVARAERVEAAALGAGMLAAAAGGLYPDVAAAAEAMAPEILDSFQPDSRNYRFYSDEFSQVYRPLYPAIRNEMNALARLK